MAKDSFFIRTQAAIVDPAGGGLGTYTEVPIDLGAFVDALGEHVLEIHRVSATYNDGTVGGYIAAQGISGTKLNWQLTTQAQSTLITPNDKSLISAGSLFTTNDAGGAVPALAVESYDINPEQWTNSYMVAVEQIYLGTAAFNDIATGDATVDIVLECTVGKMTKGKAMALALSQQ